MIPIIIISYNRPKMLLDMIEAIERFTFEKCYEIIVCDNASRNMGNALEVIEKKHKVIRNGKNLVFEGLNPALKIIQERGDKYFIISDPDILIQSEIPGDWPEIMAEILDKTNYPKVGLALNIKFQEDSLYTQEVIKTELGYWQKKIDIPFIPDPCFEALTDTTMAIYRRDTFDFWKDGNLLFDRQHGIEGAGWIGLNRINKKYIQNSLRIAGRFTAEHVGWYLNPKYDSDWQNIKSPEIYKISSTANKIHLKERKNAN